MGVSNAFIRAHPDTTCGGLISFANASGRRFARPFIVRAEHERVALVHSEETPKTQFELQKIPKELERVAREIATLGEVIERGSRIAPSNIELATAERRRHVERSSDLNSGLTVVDDGS